MGVSTVRPTDDGLTVAAHEAARRGAGTCDADLRRAPRRRWALLPSRLLFRRPRWWEEVAFVLLAYWLYTLVRNTVPTHETAALHRARELLALETSLHIDVERSINAFVAAVHPLAYAANYYYATLHFVVTIGVLVWLYRVHPLRYRALRSVLFATNIVALFGFWLYALAPPRMLFQQGFIDTVVRFHTWGSWASGDVASASNQYAAMPSLHIGWSLWCGVVIAALASRRWVRVLGVLYPIATFAVIIGTANHFVLDAVGGVVALGIGFTVQRALSGRAAFAVPYPAPAKRSRALSTVACR